MFVLGTIVLGFLFFARSARPLLRRTQPLLVRLRLERPLRHFYESIHHYRGRPRLLAKVLAVTLVVQAVRILSIWAAAKAVGIDLDPRIYFVFGPLLFLVMLVPFTLNGIAVREAFFVSFLGSVGVGANQAFAAGFLFFLVTCSWRARRRLVLCARGSAASRGRGSSMADRASRRSSSPTTRCRGSSSASTRSAESRRSSSTTARATARSRSCASAIRTCASSRPRTEGSAPAGTSGSARPRARTRCS